MRKELDLFANVRPVKVPGARHRLDVLPREHRGRVYAVGSQGVQIDGRSRRRLHRYDHRRARERIARLAFDYAQQKPARTACPSSPRPTSSRPPTASSLKLCQNVGEEYPEIVTDDWYIDIMTAKLVDEKRRRDFQGRSSCPTCTATSSPTRLPSSRAASARRAAANIGKRYAMFEAIHGSAPRMVKEGRAKYADPCLHAARSRHAARAHR